jgi:hypothetical protein
MAPFTSGVTTVGMSQEVLSKVTPLKILLSTDPLFPGSPLPACQIFNAGCGRRAQDVAAVAAMTVIDRYYQRRKPLAVKRETLANER